jgi:hypothetical protein
MFGVVGSGSRLIDAARGRQRRRMILFNHDVLMIPKAVVFELSTLGDELPSFTKTIGYKNLEVFGPYFVSGRLSHRKD